jgi:hypothetical protein
MLQGTLCTFSTDQLLSRCHNALVMLSDTGSHIRSQGNEHSSAVTKCNQLSAHATLIPSVPRTQEQNTTHGRCSRSGCLHDGANKRETDAAQWKANRAPLVGDQLSMRRGGGGEGGGESQGSSIDTVTERPRYRGSIPSGRDVFSALQHPDWLWQPPGLLPIQQVSGFVTLQ